MGTLHAPTLKCLRTRSLAVRNQALFSCRIMPLSIMHMRSRNGFENTLYHLSIGLLIHQI